MKAAAGEAGAVRGDDCRVRSSRQPSWLDSLIAIIALMTVLGATACLRRPTTDPNRLVVGLTSGPNNLDPRFGLDDVSQKLHQLIYDSLLVLDDRMQLVPNLAERFENPTPTTYVVTLRQGVRFHDGHELTARDVAWTFNSMLDPGLGSPRRGGLLPLQRVDVVDRYTARFVLAEPYTSFPINLLLTIVPEGADASLKDHPVGSGPYAFVSQVIDDQVVLQAFPGYWQGPPRNSGLLLKVVPDEVMRALEVNHGTMDVVVNDISPDIYFQLRRSRDIQTTTSDGVDSQYMGINLQDPILRDVRVRQAIAYGIDRQAIVDYLRRGLAAPATTLLPPLSWAQAKDVRQYPHDPDRARALLDAAGYRDPDGDGPLPRFTLTLKVSNVEYNRAQSAVIQEQLRAVGIAIDVRAYEFATLFADVIGGNFQLYTLQWTAGSLADPDILRRIFHSSQTPPTGYNRGHYSNPELDRLLERAAASRDSSERHALYASAQEILAEDLPYIPVWWKTNFAIARRDLDGVVLNPYAEFTFLRQVSRLAIAASN